MGESKSQILAKLPSVPEFALIAWSLSTEDRLEAAREFLAVRNLDFPIVLKPNVGERGNGVAIIGNERELDGHLRSVAGDTIIQKYAGGLEFGIFYYRHPNGPNGRIFSITEKRFPHVYGDGNSSIRDLILGDERAVCLSGVYLARLKRSRDEVPAAGEAIPLTELGSHCKGAIFLNAGHLETDALRSALDSAAKSHPGFFFGRFDVRAPSVADLQAGRFDILELNGVSAEAAHIYDPSISFIEAYRVLFQQWKIAFEIGAANRKNGAEPVPLLNFLHSLRTGGASRTAVRHWHPEKNLLSGNILASDLDVDVGR